MFKHGSMIKPQYSYDVVINHLRRTGWQDFKGKTVLEMGPGDSLFTALVARSLGADKIILVDVWDFAIKDLKIYREMSEYLRSEGLEVPNITNCNKLSDVLSVCNAIYLTEGLSSYKNIPDNSIDFIFSQAVLEHVRKNEFIETINQTKRILTNEGISSHVVDLKDHIGGSLNNLRFSENVWESNFFANSGFYTNRIRYHEMVSIFKNINLSIKSINARSWDKLPVNKSSMDQYFRKFKNEELLISGFDIVLQK